MLSNSCFQEKPTIKQNLRENCKQTTLKTNLIRLRINPKEKTVYIYSITFDSSVPLDNTHTKKIILKNSSHELREKLGKYSIAGDNLFSTTLLQENLEITTKIIIEETERDHTLLIRRVENYSIDLTKTIDANDVFYRQKKAFVEILIKHIMTANKMLRMKRIYFDKNEYRELNYNGFSGNLYSGFQTAAKVCEMGMFLSLSIKHKVINKKSCLDQIKHIRDESSGSDFQRRIRDFFSGRTVQANYGKYAFYRIDDVTFEKNVMNTSMRRRNKNNGNYEEISLYQYYIESYDKTVGDQRQPLFISSKKNPVTDIEENIFLVPEFLLMTGFDDDLRDNENVKRDMIKLTQMRPNERMGKIKEFRDLIYKKGLKNSYKDRVTGESRPLPDPEDIRAEWGLDLNPNALEVNGRILEKPQVTGFKGKPMVMMGEKVNYRDVPLHTPCRFERERWIIFFNDRNNNDADKVVSSFKTCCRGIGISVEDPKFFSHKCRRVEDYLDEFDRIRDLGRYSIILIILNRNEKSFYKQIKNHLMTKYGIPSQVVVRENLIKNLSYFTNVLLQMNYKVGGEPFVIENLHRTSMIVGLDATRIPGSASRNFVMVSSYDTYCSKYYTCIQRSNPDSNVGPAASLIMASLKKFEKMRERLPDYIFIYRSGSSEREKELIFKNELQGIKDSLKIYKEGYEPKLCFIIVNKKSEMKFFEGDRNPQSGTVVDLGCVSPFIYEFYIQPQYVNQGIATPTNFHVIYDETKIPSEILQEFSYQLCYYYFNWSGPIRVPAPLKYAEVCNKFVTSNLSGSVESENLKSSAYYI